jgi:hypothetical protein
VSDVTRPILLRFDGNAFVPSSAVMLKRAREGYEIGETYRIIIEEDDASDKSRAHFYACNNTTWKNLPEDLAARFPTPKHLRDWTLIKAGFATERDMVLDSEERAKAIGFVLRSELPYAVLSTSGPVLKVWTAKSTKRGSMKRAEFQAAKTQCLAIWADMIGAKPADIQANAGPDPYEDKQPNPPNLPEEAQREPTPADTPATPQPGSFTPEKPSPPKNAARPGSPLGAASGEEANRPEQTVQQGGGGLIDINPKTPDEFDYYLKAWLGFTMSSDRIIRRFQREINELIPTLVPPATDAEIERWTDLAGAAAAGRMVTAT